MRRHFFSLLALITSCVAMPVAAQTVAIDSICARAYKGEVDSASRRFLASVQKTMPKYQQRALGRLDARTGTLCEVVVNTPPPPSGPVARFTATCDTARCTLDARSSSGAIDSFAWHASGGGRPDKTGSLIIRSGSSDAPNAWDETLTVTDSSGATARVTQRVALAAPSQPPPSTPPPTQPPPAPVPSGPGFVYGAELPRVVPIAPTGIESRACTDTIAPPRDLQNALNAAKGNASLCIVNGATYQGTFYLPTSTDSGWKVLRSLTAAPVGARVVAAPGLARLETTGLGAASTLIATAGARRWYLHSLDIGVAPSVNTSAAPVGAIVEIFGTDIWLDRTYIHPQPTQSIMRCVSLQGASDAIVHSALRDCHGKGIETQGIAMWRGPGPYLIDDNDIWGSGENILAGGADPGVPNQSIADVTITRNWLYTPPAWKGVWSKKNILELKHAIRVRVEGNVFDGSWPDAQTGTALMYFSINQQGGCPWCRVTDVVTRANHFKNVAMGWNLSGTQEKPVDTTARRLVFVANVIDSVIYGGTDGILTQVLGKGRDLVIDSLVANAGGGTIKSTLGIEVVNPWTNVTYQNVVATFGRYGIFSSNGTGTTAFAQLAGTVVTNNIALIGASPGSGYGGMTFVASEAQVPLAAAIRARVAAATAGVVRP